MDLLNLLRKPPPPPFFQIFYVPALAAGATKDYDAENTLRAYRKFAPFVNAQVINTSSVNIEVSFDYNANRKIFSAAGGAPGTHNQPFWSFQVKNIGSNPTQDNQVIIWIEKL
ncbi:MAG: hypothetical protein PHH85_01645 [Candidatus Methanoperedens sp.]|nr:hypothetical protein [Candidatus Methanoperedens sp.]